MEKQKEKRTIKSKMKLKFIIQKEGLKIRKITNFKLVLNSHYNH